MIKPEQQLTRQYSDAHQAWNTLTGVGTHLGQIVRLIEVAANPINR